MTSERFSYCVAGRFDGSMIPWDAFFWDLYICPGQRDARADYGKSFLLGSDSD